jgi:hypothetical protein
MLRRSVSRAAMLVLGLTMLSAAPSPAQAPGGDDARRVIAIREITLKSDANAQEFEQSFSNVYARAVEDRIPGMQTYLLRGERGQRTGKYLMVFEIDSLARRNEYWPQPDVSSEKFTQLWEGMPEYDIGKYVEAEPEDVYTDYLVLKP